jgi:recombinational DNA repair protein RecR
LLQDDLTPLNSKDLCNLLFGQLQEKLQGCSKKELFLALFDSMESDEQAAVLEALNKQSAAKISR